MPTNQAVETAVLTEVYAAINRNDMAAALQFFDPQVERIEPAGFPSAGTYRGHAEVKEHLARGRATWAEGGCEPERFLVAGERVVVFVHVRVRLKGMQDWLDARLADVFTFHNGKVTQMRTFGEEQEALAWSQSEPP